MNKLPILVILFLLFFLIYIDGQFIIIIMYTLFVH